MNNWIETSGSPFVIVEQQYAHQWKGQENYNAICSVTDNLGKIYIDNHVLLVMGDEPMATRIVNKDGAILIIRWKYAPDYLTVEKLLENLQKEKDRILEKKNFCDREQAGLKMKAAENKKQQQNAAEEIRQIHQETGKEVLETEKKEKQQEYRNLKENHKKAKETFERFQAEKE